MTRAEVLALPAGPALDALVAERVMGWTREPHPDGVWTHLGWWRGREWMAPAEMRHTTPMTYPWSPSTDIAASWRVVQALDGDFNVELHNGGDTELPDAGNWVFRIYADGTVYVGAAATAEVAVCRAALLAKLQLRSEAA